MKSNVAIGVVAGVAALIILPKVIIFGGLAAAGIYGYKKLKK